MKLKKIDIFVTKVELKKSQKTGEAYLIVEFIDTVDQSTYSIVEKDIELMQQLKGMNKYKVDLTINGTKYGIKMNIDAVLEHLGGI